MQFTIYKIFEMVKPIKSIRRSYLFRFRTAVMISTGLALSSYAHLSYAKDNNTIAVEQSSSLAQPISVDHNSVFPAQIISAMQKVKLSRSNISFIITPLPDNKLVPVELKSEEEKETLKTTNSTGKDSQDAIDTIVPNPPLSSSRYQENIPRTPASTMKLIPTFIALDTLGKDFFWMTNAYYSGQIIGNRLYGDLIIKGSGDPKLTHQKVADLLYQIEQAGIHHIEGDIILDSNIFTNVGKNPAKFDGEPLRPYNASPDGLLVNFNAITIDSYPIDNGQSQLLYTPNLADMDLPNIISTRSGRCSSNISLSLAPRWRHNNLRYGKSIPNACQRYSFYIAYPNPKTFAQKVIKAKWLERGNSIAGEIRNHTDSRLNSPKLSKLSYFSNDWLKITSPYPIAITNSYRLSQQIYDINHHSNNVMTEQLLLSTSAYQDFVKNNGKIKQSTDYPQALSSINQWWQSNLTTSLPYMTNGSGLCRECTVTVANLNELLGKAYMHPDFNTYVHSLGVAGISGTIKTHKNRLPKSAAIGRAWIKTGTLGNVTAMAGYIKGKSGQEYSVVAIINLDKEVRNANKYRPVLDSMIDWVAQH